MMQAPARQYRVPKWLVFVFRVMMGWTFLYAGTWQILSGTFSAGPFLESTKTFHDVYAPMAASPYLPYISFAAEWGALLIGLSLVSGLLVRVSGVFCVLLLVTYWTAHMDFPYIENRNSFIVDYHMVYAFLTGWLVAVNAGYAYGLDGWRARRRSAAMQADAVPQPSAG